MKSEIHYKLVLHKQALSELKKLPKKIKEQVKQSIDSLVTNPRPAVAARLRGRPNAYRIRFGDYRLLYEVHATEIVIYVLGVAHRREVYQRLLRRR
ncbi:MAG: type II toxin-antitoxin system RelE/ParE family toxin [Myxococcota bacterium]